MTEFADAPKTADPQRDAVAQIIRRIQNDADLAYLIGWGTTSYERLVAAEIAATGCTQEESETRVRYQGRARPHVKHLEERARRLERIADEYEARARSRGDAVLCRTCAGDCTVDGSPCSECDGTGERAE